MTVVRKSIRIVLAFMGSSTLVSAQDLTQAPMPLRSFQEALKRHGEMVNEYRENSVRIEQLSARNQQIVFELNYLSGYLDALFHVSKVMDKTKEWDMFSSTSRVLELPPPNQAGARPTTAPLTLTQPTSSPSVGKPSAFGQQPIVPRGTPVLPRLPGLQRTTSATLPARDSNEPPPKLTEPGGKL